MPRPKKIVITGPESVGKSTLTKQLAEYYNVSYITEIARDYIEKLNGPYSEKDVLNIAELQIQEENRINIEKSKIVFLDTDLIVTKIWLLHAYGRYPNWIDEHLKTQTASLHLLCYYDLPWQYDPVRENPNIRESLFEKYLCEIEKLNIPNRVIKGIGDIRLKNAIGFIDELIF